MIKLTTIVSNYNYAHFLEEAVLSILKQDEPNEVLIVDDASTDGSRDLIIQLAQTYSKVRYHFKEKNEGVEEANNTGLKLAKGEYVHFFSSDDICLRGSLSVFFNYVDSFPHASIICSNFAFFTHPNISEIQTQKHLPGCEAFSFYSPKEVYKLFRKTSFWISGHGVFFKKDAYLKYAPQKKDFGSISDWIINSTMALKEGLGYIPQGLIAMRRHSNNYSASFSLEKKKRMWLYLLDCMEKNPDQYIDLYKTGILRIIGLKPIFMDLLKTPRYWKYLLPIISRELIKK